ncbi:MAG: sugar transferase [Acutalibacteraceae bacterium]|jgi:lipopolysaccharide/colanic/teichoic acid biosynthesis glycosyltransferase
MLLKKWEDLPDEFKCAQVKKYYDILKRKPISLVFKRIFDIVLSLILLVILSPVFVVLAVAIKLDSKGPVFYRQVRITTYGKPFRIFKFRTMVQNADKIGTQVTGGNDSRVTKVGKAIRKYRLDEISQLIDVLRGKMTFVGVRPEVPKYVKTYTPEMMATLLLPAGITSKASIFYKDEGKLLDSAEDIDKTYIETILPDKMYYNLKSLEEFSFFEDIKVMFMTLFAVFGKEYTAKRKNEG